MSSVLARGRRAGAAMLFSSTVKLTLGRANSRGATFALLRAVAFVIVIGGMVPALRLRRLVDR